MSATLFGALGTNDPADRESERRARAAWSALAEPSDATAAALVATYGPVAALEVVTRGAVSNAERWAPRIAALDVDADLAAAARCGARVVIPGDPDWPRRLDDLPEPPMCLWVRGPADLGSVCERSVAIVGARAATAYGISVAADLAAGVGDRGFAVVSGAAAGIDAAAHRGALAVGAVTVAVLAGGVDRAYPRENERLLDEIAETGAIVSEVPPGGLSLRARFLKRNRLIAAMSAGTIVVEAGIRSGSRNTAATAATLGRPVGAIPGPVTSMNSAGCHEIIRDGSAALVTDAAEVAELVGSYGTDLAPVRRAATRFEDTIDPADREVYDALPVWAVVSTDRVAVVAGTSVAAATAALGRLMLSGLVRSEQGGWRRAPRS